MNIQLELSSVCNLRCKECPQRLMQRKRQFMTDAVFVRALEYIIHLENREKELGYPPTIILHKDGEPLLHPKIMKYLMIISLLCPDFKLNIYTNGTKLTPEFLHFLTQMPNKTSLLVSYHFFNEDRSENDYAFTERLIRWFAVQNRPNVELILASHVTQYVSEGFLNTWKSTYQQLEDQHLITVHVNKAINPWTGLIQEENCVSFEACPYADFGHLFIGVTGNVIPCCMDLEEELSVGNIMHEDRHKLMNKMQDLYNRLHEERIYWPELCKRCVKAKEE